MWILAHFTIRPNDGKEPFVVETEFTAANYATAYDHVRNAAAKMGGTLMSHRFMPAPGCHVLEGETVPILPPPPVHTIPAPKEPLAPEWFGKAVVTIPKINMLTAEG